MGKLGKLVVCVWITHYAKEEKRIARKQWFGNKKTGQNRRIGKETEKESECEDGAKRLSLIGTSEPGKMDEAMQKPRTGRIDFSNQVPTAAAKVNCW